MLSARNCPDLAVFIAHMLRTLETFKHHYLIRKKQKAAHLELERNFQPHQLLIDVDFAENFTIMMGREIQSQHWISKMVTLFIGITQHLCLDAWNDTHSSIDKGREITIQSADGNAHPMWASVSADYKQGSAHVLVADSRGKEQEVLRSNVRVRKLVNTAHVMVSDDKTPSSFRSHCQ